MVRSSWLHLLAVAVLLGSCHELVAYQPRASADDAGPSDGAIDVGGDAPVDASGKPDAKTYPSPNEAGTWSESVRLVPRANGDGFAMVWVELSPSGSTQVDLRFAVVERDGTVGPAKTLVQLLEKPQSIELLATSDGYLAVYNTNRLYLLVIEGDGVSWMEKKPVGEHDDITHPSLVATSTGPVILYDRQVTVRQVMAQKIDAEGSAEGAEQYVDKELHWQSSPRGVWAKDHLLIVWQDYRLGSSEPRVRISAGPGGPSTRITQSKNKEYAPRIVAGPDDQFLVAWESLSALSGIVVDHEGAQVSTPVIELIPANRFESLDRAITGSNKGYALIWQSDHGVVLPQIRYRLVQADDGVLVPATPIALTNDGSEHRNPTIAITDGAGGIAHAWIGVGEDAWRIYVGVSDGL